MTSNDSEREYLNALAELARALKDKELTVSEYRKIRMEVINARALKLKEELIPNNTTINLLTRKTYNWR